MLNSVPFMVRLVRRVLVLSFYFVRVVGIFMIPAGVGLSAVKFLQNCYEFP
uniref:Uncharacterized protein n=1 Tax=Arundo donax TaxID=35708 RepID=A0A0A9C5R9_ARUDO